MPTPSLPSTKVRAILDAIDRSLTNREVAKECKVSVGVVSKVRNGYRRGGGKELPGEVNVPVDTRDEHGGETTIVTPDKPLSVQEMAALFKVDLKVWVPISIKTNQWQGFYKAGKTWRPPAGGRDGVGTARHEKVALFQTSVTWKRIMGESLELELLEFFRTHVRPLPKPRLVMQRGGKVGGDGVMVTWGIWDAHLGMYAWHQEVGESMDLTKAVSRVTNSIDDMVQRLAAWPQRIERLVLPIGNDFMHYDNARQKTTYGEHHLDADGRYAKVYTAGLRCLVYMLERAVELCPNVEVIFVPGNHDMHSGYTMTVALSQRFLNDSRIKFNLSPKARKYITFGGTLLGFDHGQKVTPRQLSMIFSTECAKVWSESKYREVQVGHIHQERVREYESITPTNGIKIRVNPALCNLDVYHFESGLIGEPVKSVEAWVYSRTGFEGSMVAWARDDFNQAIDQIKLTKG